jgi:uncharacterized protein (DUF433 family)
MSILESLVARPVPLRTDDDGVLRVGETRVRLETILHAFGTGVSAEEILLKYPSLNLTDVYSVITYYLWHQQEIDAYLSKRKQLEDSTRVELEQKFPSAGIRERLLARSKSKD